MITQIQKRLQRFFLLLGILLLLGSESELYSFNVSPGRIEVGVAPSKCYDNVIIIRNTEKRDLEIKIRIEDWFKQSSSFKWLEISPMEFGLKESEIKEVKIKVKVPKNAKGEFNAMIFIEGRPKEIKEGAIGINTSVGIPIYVMIKGTEKFKAEVEDLKIVNRSPLELAITIKNSGNVHIRPTGTIEIINADAHRPKADLRRFTVPLNEYNYPILPNSSRTLEIRSNNRLEAGEYIADIKMGYQDKKYKKRTYLKIQ